MKAGAKDGQPGTEPGQLLNSSPNTAIMLEARAEPALLPLTPCTFLSPVLRTTQKCGPQGGVLATERRGRGAAR